jgi:hypothetical protein
MQQKHAQIKYSLRAQTPVFARHEFTAHGKFGLMHGDLGLVLDGLLLRLARTN